MGSSEVPDTTLGPIQGLDALGPARGTEVKAEDLYRCVHCGLCLNVCPTYLELGLETESPRGRLALMKAVAEGRTGYTDRLVEHLDLCLLCRACEAACPSAVPFGSLMSATRAQVLERTEIPWREKALRSLVFKHVFPHRRRLNAGFRLMRLYQDSGLRALVRRSGLMKMLPDKAREMEAMMPRVPCKFFPPVDLEFVPARGEVRARVGFFSGCIMPLLFGRVNDATVKVLTRNGCEVVIPRGQGCCGALNVHGGERVAAREMARRNIDTFESLQLDAVVINSAGCGAMLKEYEELLEDDPVYVPRARAFAARVKDVNEFLSELPLVPPARGFKERVTYQEPCHLAHAQRITEQPRRILRSIPGLELVEMPGADRCCGAAGIYNITQAELSMRLLDSKMRDLASIEADVVATANPGCMIQLDLGLRKLGQEGRSYHVVELLERAYGLEDAADLE